MSGARCIRAVADLHAAPDGTSERVSQCLFGERVDVLERADDWCLVRLHRDGYEGHVAGAALDETSVLATRPDHAAPRRRLVGVRATLLFAAPDMKSPLRLRVPFGAELLTADDGAGDGAGDGDSDDGGPRHADRTRPEARAERARFVRVLGVPVGGGDTFSTGDAFVWRDHLLAPGARLAGSPVDVARRLHDGAPYLWGGRTSDGADCSGLLQGTALALGLSLPRDSGDQERFLEHVVPFAERRASDVVFWPRHVGLLVDPDTLYHATAHSLATALEPLADVVERAGAPSSIRRLPIPPA